MAELNRITHCDDWYDLNMSALHVREIFHAMGVLQGLLGLVFMALPRLFGIPMRTGTLFPAEVTLIWEVPLDELAIPEELQELGFRPLKAFELPEFTGENVTCVLADHDRVTFCEVVFVRMPNGEVGTGMSLSSYFPGDPLTRIKTFTEWKISPLDMPPEFVNQMVPGSVTNAYEAHRSWLATFPTNPIPATYENFEHRNKIDHCRLRDFYVKRGVWIEANDEDVGRLLRKKRLREA